MGGISTGQDIHVNIAIKPTSSIATPRRSIDIEGNPVELATHGRHDPCVGLRAAPIAEAMLALVLIDHALRHRAQMPMFGLIHRTLPNWKNNHLFLNILRKI